MKISYVSVKNFKSIKSLEMCDIENALILVGKNSTGKTAIMNSLLAVCGMYKLVPSNFMDAARNIEIRLVVDISEDDLHSMNQRGVVSKYKRYDIWKNDFISKLPSFNNGQLNFTFIAKSDGSVRYADGIKKNNPYIPLVLPKLHYIDTSRQLDAIQEDIFIMQDNEALLPLRENRCLFNSGKPCISCYQCIGVIEKKVPSELNVGETVRLLEYKLFHLKMDSFVDKLNTYFHKNYSLGHDIRYTMKFNIDELLHINTEVVNTNIGTKNSMSMMSAGMKSIYILSLLEAYIDENSSLPCIIMIEDPEIYLHPQLQKVASEILYRLSKKNQVIFTTHSPNLIFNFTSKQIRQVILDDSYNTQVAEDTDIDCILDDLGYTANDVMNVSFVFIVEGKQDSARLPLLLRKYYSEIYDSEGDLHRIAIISTNSCTNIKTYANLKYINKLYLKDQFLMIRDGDGQDHETLVTQLCSYYHDREKYDRGNLPRVLPRNVLVLKYYSFENYFLDPSTMAKIGVIKNEDEFYSIFLDAYEKYLYKLPSVKKLADLYGITFKTKRDIFKNLEVIKTNVRGHNLFDLYYGRYKDEKETEILDAYINAAPREIFDDILKAIDSFVYFDSRRINSPE